MIKKIIHKTPLSRIAQEIRGKIDSAKLVDENSIITGHKTIVSISPYKTGTTFLARCYSPEVSLHEPMHFLSLKEVQKNFSPFFVQRLNTLDIKLECSGFWSAYINELRNHPLASEFRFICILRPPTKWVQSVVNHWVKIRHDMRYDYINELFWKPKVGVDLHKIPRLSGSAQKKEVQKLEEFYMRFTRESMELSNVDYFWIEQIEDYLPILDNKIGEKGNPGKSWKRGRSYQVFSYENETLDQEYAQLTDQLELAVPKNC